VRDRGERVAIAEHPGQPEGIIRDCPGERGGDPLKSLSNFPGAAGDFEAEPLTDQQHASAFDAGGRVGRADGLGLR
jgi:hypothetical protein